MILLLADIPVEYRSTETVYRSTDSWFYCSILLSGWVTVDISAVSVDRFYGIGRPIVAL